MDISEVSHVARLILFTPKTSIDVTPADFFYILVFRAYKIQQCSNEDLKNFNIV